MRRGFLAGRGHAGQRQRRPLIKLSKSPPTRRPGNLAIYRCRATLERHTAAVWCLAFSPQGKTLASGGLDNTCRLWNPQTGVLRAATRVRYAVISSAFAPDASALVMGTYAGLMSLRKAKFFDTPLAGPLKTIAGPPDTLMAVAISPMVSCGVGRQRSNDQLRRLPACEPVRELGGHPSGICHLAISPDGKTLGACLYNGQVCCGTPGRTETWQLSGHPKGTPNFSPDGTIAADGRNRPNRQALNVASGKLLVDTGPGLARSDVSSSPDGRTLATATGNRRSGGSRRIGAVRPRRRRTGHVGGHALEIKGAMFDPRRPAVLHGPTARGSGISLRAGNKRCLPKAPSLAATFPDGNHLAIGDNQGGMAIWHIETGRPVLQYTGHEDLVFHLAWVPDGSLWGQRRQRMDARPPIRLTLIDDQHPVPTLMLESNPATLIDCPTCCEHKFYDPRSATCRERKATPMAVQPPHVSAFRFALRRHGRLACQRAETGQGAAGGGEFVAENGVALPIRLRGGRTR